jgi:hypothetical protein
MRLRRSGLKQVSWPAGRKMPCHRLKLIEKAIRLGLIGAIIPKAGGGAGRTMHDLALINFPPTHGEPSKQLLRQARHLANADRVLLAQLDCRALWESRCFAFVKSNSLKVIRNLNRLMSRELRRQILLRPLSEQGRPQVSRRQPLGDHESGFPIGEPRHSMW